jgi:hypothetical protein
MICGAAALIVAFAARAGRAATRSMKARMFGHDPKSIFTKFAQLITVKA